MKNNKPPDSFEQWKDSENWIRWPSRPMVDKKLMLNLLISVAIGAIGAITIVCLAFPIAKSIWR